MEDRRWSHGRSLEFSAKTERQPRRKEIMECRRCGTTCTEEEMMEHVIGFHVAPTRAPWRCSICGFKVYNRTKLVDHVKTERHKKAQRLNPSGIMRYMPSDDPYIVTPGVDYITSAISDKENRTRCTSVSSSAKDNPGLPKEVKFNFHSHTARTSSSESSCLSTESGNISEFVEVSQQDEPAEDNVLEETEQRSVSNSTQPAKIGARRHSFHGPDIPKAESDVTDGVNEQDGNMNAAIPDDVMEDEGDLLENKVTQTLGGLRPLKNIETALIHIEKHTRFMVNTLQTLVRRKKTKRLKQVDQRKRKVLNAGKT